MGNQAGPPLPATPLLPGGEKRLNSSTFLGQYHPDKVPRAQNYMDNQKGRDGWRKLSQVVTFCHTFSLSCVSGCSFDLKDT
ncbi:hypothetical protein M1271_03525 [Patescibacteria group bacterium]|nr:hypothetical protein [Patescibacteria group bacterium]MCL5797836.1 hypothetical protein [Patescibacteria group bacterium]